MQTLAYSAVHAEMETSNEELARVQRERRRKTTEGASECEGRRGRAREVNGAIARRTFTRTPCVFWAVFFVMRDAVSMFF